PPPNTPFHIIPNIQNLRDTALYPLTTPSGPIRPHTLFRSADVSKLTPTGWTSLSTLGITHIFDLRSAGEISSSPDDSAWMHDLVAAGLARSWTPVFAEQDYRPEKLAERYVRYMEEGVRGFVSAYESILRGGGGAYAEIFRHLARPSSARNGGEGNGILVHCSVGKDRTGMFFAVLFDFLGVGREAIAEEYHLTEMGLREVRDGVVERLMRLPVFKNYIAGKVNGKGLTQEEIARLIEEEKDGVGNGVGDEFPKEALEEGRAAALRMVGAKKESMLKSLEMLDREFGGAEKYMRNMCGLGDGELDALRRNLIVKA
ncbi:tyrosine phosphatase family-domain-containing protein, partial [Phaeosphaeriaceae sp. PMI808]